MQLCMQPVCDRTELPASGELSISVSATVNSYVSHGMQWRRSGGHFTANSLFLAIFETFGPGCTGMIM